MREKTVQAKQNQDKQAAADDGGSTGGIGLSQLMAWFQQISPELVFWLELVLSRES